MTTRQGNKAGRGAVLEHKCAALSTEFGMKMLQSKFPNDAALYLAVAGTYSRGPRKGMPKGYIHWIKVVEGGWDYSRNQRGVLRGGCIEWRVLDGMDPESDAIDIPRDPTPYFERNENRRNEEESAMLSDVEFELKDYPSLIPDAIAAAKAKFAKARERNAESFAKELAEYKAKRAALIGEGT